MIEIKPLRPPSQTAIMIVRLAFLTSFLIGFSTTGGARAAVGSDLPANTTEEMIKVGSRERTYVIHAAPGVGEREPAALVIVLHGGGANAPHAMLSTRFNEKADSEGFIVAYANGSASVKRGMLTWNAGVCCAYAKKRKIDDVGFIRALIEKIENEYKIDPSMIYATGFSNGGMLTHHLGCGLSDRLAAIAPVAGCVTTPGCKPSDPISVIMLHGTNDQNVPYEGGVGKRAFVKLKKKSVKYAIKLWTRHNKCTETPVVEENGTIRKDAWSCEATGTEVVLYTIEGGGHSWPGGKKVFIVEDDPTNAISATDVIWDFFKSHPKAKQLGDE